MQRVYDAVWDLLFADLDGPNALSNWIKVGNRIDFMGNDDNPYKERTQNADVPELMLAYEGGNFNPHANSCQMEYYMNLTIYCSSGDYRARINTALDWYIICNWETWQRTLSGIKWKGNTFVTNLQVIPVQTGESNPERNRQIKGWTSIWRAQLQLRIPRLNCTFTES